ncbi:hypothetical protein LP420_31665 [Massilia sp. B-10]|nr:hypothetical protein LP420_31665 [Massilia sp. B-10]UUZ53311.1 hypothetical protein LP419_31190 [Massilia sp. H-1]
MMGLDPERIDALLAHTRDAHLAVADMMDDIGYTEFSSDRLRAGGRPVSALHSFGKGVNL